MTLIPLYPQGGVLLAEELLLILSVTMQHDENYKKLFSNKRMIELLIEKFVPSSIQTQLDISSLHRLDTTFITKGLQTREADLVWKIQTNHGQSLYFCLLLEFQSSVDHAMALRCLSYTTLLYDLLLKADPSLARKQQLPPIIPIVIYNQPQPWNAKLNIQDLIAYGLTPKALQPYQPHQTYFLIDEYRLNKTTLNSNKDPLSILFLLERSKTIQETKRLVFELVEILQNEEGAYTLGEGFASWIKQALPHKHIEIEHHHFASLRGLKDMLKENMERYWQQVHDDAQEKGLKLGIEQGIEQGLEQGIEQGLKQGKLQTLQKLIELKFGEQSQTQQEQLEQLNLSQLEKITEQILKASSMEELLSIVHQ